ncbi:LacI family transcriptional regulator [Novosphingobium sp. SG751A]|uniref:LacI family DNA-binding transcriptional regulator n=1 Tax=Novosphingobium sp. SG751A TaxID=2587000 RepID=UPI001556091F|nr:LacI family DNA-binding transcriptional regulator [Novosphingobium sp. SG751A]NOW48353.1 LacI family transcriptional regulator [Novosphingobium sp. SG751A]
MATIKDVAQHSGISIKTVSRVINGAQTVRPGVREKVERAIRELHYRPALAARQLASGRSFIIAMIAPRLTYSYFSRIMVATADACRKVGYHLVLEVMDGEDLSITLSCEPDAVIVVPPFADNRQVLAALMELGKPVVRIAGKDDGIGRSVEVHDHAIAREMAQYLAGRGHSVLAMIAPPRPDMAAEERLTGFRAGLAENGLDLSDSHVVRAGMTFAEGERAFRDLMALPQRPTAIFAANDQMALGAMACALRLGFRVPQDVAIAGFDNSVEGQMCYPALTSVHQPVEEIARIAVDLALDRGDGDASFAHHLVIRESA